MGYQGITQTLCENAHYQEIDVYEELSFETDGSCTDKTKVCAHCGANIVWRNGVDQTNCCGALGYSEFLPHEERCCMGYTEEEANEKCNHIGVGYVQLHKIAEERKRPCECCGHEKVIEPARYKIPQE